MRLMVPKEGKPGWGEIVSEGSRHEPFCTVLPEEVSESITGVRGEGMFLAGKAACAGIIFLLLATGISGPRPTKVVPGPNLSKEEPAVGPRTDVLKTQETLRDKGHYRGKIDGVFGLRTRASIRAFQKAQGQPPTGQLDTQAASKLGVKPEGRGKTAYEATQEKPSAGIRSVRGSWRTSKFQPKAVDTVAAPDSTRGDPETPQAENEKDR
jgi:hypothetical protein